MKIGVFDIGSNSLRLLWGECCHNKWEKSNKQIWTTRLGAKMPDSTLLTVESINATIAAFEEGISMAKAEGVKKFYAYATAAVREAENKMDFLHLIKEKFSVDVAVWTGEEEAEYSFIGAARDYVKNGTHSLVIDIGGSSTELALGNNREVYWKQSYPIGAMRCKKISDEGPQRVWEELNGLWLPLPLKGEFGEFIGVGGTITTLAAMDLGLNVYDANRVQGHLLTREAVEGQALFLRYMSEAEKADIPCLHAKRRDIIVPGAEILCAFMDAYDIGHIMVSDCDGLDGYLESL